jgi:hypothetical protein
MSDSYSIKILVVDGDPEGVRVIDRMNWTGQGIAFRREDWQTVKSRSSFMHPGIYMLFGYDINETDDELLTIYIGEGDGIKDRIESHYKNKDFWSWGIAFVSTNSSLNKAHVQWLEYKFVERAKEIGRCKLSNSNNPQEPLLNEADKADTFAFFKEILQILPLVGVRVFEQSKKITPDKNKSESLQSSLTTISSNSYDTVVVPALKEGFDKVFIGENRWWAIRLAGGALSKIKYIAAYQTAPVSAITHIAEVSSIQLYGDTSKYQVNFSGPAKQIEAIKLDKPSLALQNIRYTTKEKLLKSKTLSELFN